MKKLIPIVMLTMIMGYVNAQNDQKVIESALDAWHQAATDANFENYFGFIAEEGIYLGTDETERWTKDQFMEFAKPYFEKGKAWDFKARDRFIIFSDDGKLAWFDENLDTWMGPCRGSGVLKKGADGWFLYHYNLAMLVPNDKVKGYLELFED